MRQNGTPPVPDVAVAAPLTAAPPLPQPLPAVPEVAVYAAEDVQAPPLAPNIPAVPVLLAILVDPQPPVPPLKLFAPVELPWPVPPEPAPGPATPLPPPPPAPHVDFDAVLLHVGTSSEKQRLLRHRSGRPALPAVVKPLPVGCFARFHPGLTQYGIPKGAHCFIRSARCLMSACNSSPAQPTHRRISVFFYTYKYIDCST